MSWDESSWHTHPQHCKQENKKQHLTPQCKIFSWITLIKLKCEFLYVRAGTIKYAGSLLSCNPCWNSWRVPIILSTMTRFSWLHKNSPVIWISYRRLHSSLISPCHTDTLPTQQCTESRSKAPHGDPHTLLDTDTHPIFSSTLFSAQGWIWVKQHV